MALWDAGGQVVGGAPALLCGLPGDVQAERDVGPAVAVGAQAGDGVLDGRADLVGDGGHVGDCFDVACCDAAAVGAYDAPEEGGVLVVLDDRRRRFGVKKWLTVDGRSPRRGVIGPTSLRSRCIRPLSAVCSRASRCRMLGRCAVPGGLWRWPLIAPWWRCAWAWPGPRGRGRRRGAVCGGATGSVRRCPARRVAGRWRGADGW